MNRGIFFFIPSQPRSLQCSRSVLVGGQDDGSKNIPFECYGFLSAKTADEREQLFKILLEMGKYRSK